MTLRADRTHGRVVRLTRTLAHLRSIMGHALPQVCALCADRSGDSLLCAPCMNALPPLPAACPVCARPSPGGAACGACLQHPPAFAGTIAACSYAFPLDRLVQALKYEHRLALAEPLGDALAAAVATRARSRAPFPTRCSPSRCRQRGSASEASTNRSRSRASSRAAFGVLLSTGLVRTGNAPPQATLPWARRRRNVRGAFACTASFAGSHVAIVDDVMTTGATLDAAAVALRRAGAARVDAWVVARTLPPRRELPCSQSCSSTRRSRRTRAT